jgi:hypothetical protein
VAWRACERQTLCRVCRGERDAGRSGPRLLVRQMRTRVASDASDAVGANAMNSNAGTRGTRMRDGRYCAVSVGLAIDANVQRLSPPFLLYGEANG